MVTIYRLNDFLLAVYKLLTSSHVLVISLSRVTTVSDWRSSDNCLRMLPLNQSEQIGVWMLKFHQLKKYLMANEVGNTAKPVQALVQD